MGLSVLNPTFEEFGSHHCHSYKKKKAEQIENQQLFLGPAENYIVEQTSTLKSIQTGKYRKVTLKYAYLENKSKIVVFFFFF